MPALSDPVMLMILPAALVFAGMLTGFVLWSWARGIDNYSIDDIQEELRRLGSQVRKQAGATETVDLQFENDELRTQVDVVSDRLKDVENELEDQRSRNDVLNSEVALAERTIDDLRRQLREFNLNAATSAAPELESELVDEEVVSPRLYQPVVREVHLSLDMEYGGEVVRDEMLGLVYSRPPLVRDNLQLISGIASRIEQQLNEFGVFTFQQIMLWDEDNICEFSRLLGTFQDRIERDDWIGQAAILYRKSSDLRRSA